MPTPRPSLLWLLLALAALITGLLALADPATPPQSPVLVALFVLVAVITAASVISAPARRFIGLPIRWLRARPALYWLVTLIFFIIWISLWLVSYQPANGRWLLWLEYAYLLAGLWGLVYLLGYGFSAEDAREMAQRLSQSRWTGILITLTTIVVIFFLGEAYLRLFYVTTDSYGFTAMNYHWYRNFGWSQDNSLGYRDHEPLPDAPGLTRVAVVGDSFAMGHGINNLDDTFAQILERRLGACCDINLLAESGWDTDLELPFLQQYPHPPDVVVLSYYLNDIDYLLKGTEQDPDENFTFIADPNLSWFVLNFFLPNYLYYNLLQFTSTARASGFVGDLFSAYDNQVYWDEQRFRLSQMIDWTETNNMRLVVLLWPHLTAIDASQAALDKVRDVFNARAVPIVDMTPMLRPYSPGQLIVNRFDAHPSIFAHTLAADALEPIVRAAVDAMSR